MSKIIVVDDDLTNVGLLKMLLELDGFTVTACTDIEQAKAAATDGVSAFIIDWHLARGVSGSDLARAIRQGETPASSDTIIIVTSGDYRRSDEAVQAGADLFLLKPYPPNELSRKLSDLLASGGHRG